MKFANVDDDVNVNVDFLLKCSELNTWYLSIVGSVPTQYFLFEYSVPTCSHSFIWKVLRLSGISNKTVKLERSKMAHFKT